MGFQEQTGAFFDEMSNIITEQMKEKATGEVQETETPFSSMLTQDEEPVTVEEGMVEDPEPEVITRHGV